MKIEEIFLNFSKNWGDFPTFSIKKKYSQQNFIWGDFWGEIWENVKKKKEIWGAVGSLSNG